MTYTRLNPVDEVTTQDGWTITTRTDGKVEIQRDAQVTVSGGGWSTWGSIYYATITDRVAYPFEFKYRPTVRVEMYRQDGHDTMGVSLSGMNSPYTTSPRLYVLSASNYNTETTVGVTLYVTGVPA